MVRPFQIPLINFLFILVKNGGVSLFKIAHILPWMVKFVLFLPLQLAEYFIYYKKISRWQLREDPIFILGHYRSGTTYLQRLLIQDKRFGYLTVFGSSLPELMLGFEWLLKPLLSSITYVIKPTNKFHKILFSWDFPGEEDVALTAFGFKQSVHWGHIFPGKLEEYFNNNVLFKGTVKAKEAWIGNYLYFLKKLSIRHGNRQLVLKSPPNTARIPTLLKLFPKARFIYIHRDPFDVFASSKRFWDIINNNYALEGFNEERKKELIIYSYNKLVEEYLKYRGLISPGKLVEIRYETLRDEPVKTIKKIYDELSLGGFDEASVDMELFVESSSDYEQTRHRLSDKEELLIRENWSELLRCFLHEVNEPA